MSEMLMYRDATETRVPVSNETASENCCRIMVVM